MKKAMKIISILFASFFLIVIIALIVDISNDDNQSATVPTKGEEAEVENQSVSWEDKIMETAASDLSVSEKFDEVSIFANDYSPSEEEIADFEEHILAQYNEKKYLKDLSNDEYMLGNIFKSQVVEKYYGDENKDPIKAFAFDFWQNSKYVYRGVDEVDSESTLANERQMDRALSKNNN